MSLDDIRESAIDTWVEHGRNTTDAAAALGIPRTTLRDALKRWRDEEANVTANLNNALPAQEDSDWSSTYTFNQFPEATLKFGVISDTHLCSKEEQLESLQESYKWFAEREVQFVLHAGDLVAGLGIYRQQVNDLTHHTVDDQIAYAVENYPSDVDTYLISGNHDLEGSVATVGIDPVAAIASQRPDIHYLGRYDATVNFPNGVKINLLHGKGGMSSPGTKAQKIVRATPPEHRCDAYIIGHYHQLASWFEQGALVLFPGCFEGRTELLKRLSMSPDVAATIMTISKPKGSIVHTLEHRVYDE